MPMQAESLEVLEQAEVAPAQARAIVRAIEIELAGAKDTLATKQDLAALEIDWTVDRTFESTGSRPRFAPRWRSRARSSVRSSTEALAVQHAKCTWRS
jgi:2-phosphoglycerate kinase